MAIVNMKDLLSEVNGYGVGAFNIVDFSSAKACIEQAELMRSPLIIQTSPKTVRFWGADTICDWFVNCAMKTKVPVVLHLDHCKDLDFIRMCIDVGWTSVMYDGSALPFAENLANTRKVSDMAHAEGVSIEGELGAIGGVEDDKSVDDDKAALADPDLAIRLAREAELDVVAPACGTAHGMYKKAPKIDFSILERVQAGCDTPLALHGGTGLSDDVFQTCIRLGCKKINVSTQLKITGIDADYEYTSSHRADYDPLKLFEHRIQSYKKMAAAFIHIFGSENRV